MTAIPDWKLQLLARRRQEEAAVRGREKAERDRLSQMPAWKRGILERRRAKLGLPPGEGSPVPGNAEAGPPDPDESAVLLEAIGPVHQNRFIQQERQRQQQQQQQQRNEVLGDRKAGPLEVLERRSSPGNLRDQSPKGRESREERLSPRESRDRRLVIGGAQDSSSRSLRDWRQSPAEARDLSSRPAEAQKWRLSPGETPEESLRLAGSGDDSPKRKEVLESILSPGEPGDQKASPTDVHKWNLDSREPQKQSLIQLEATVNPRRCAPPASPAPPVNPATADAAGSGSGKKRYPTAEEILVLGGYLRLSRSCLVKGSPERHHKQLKISFSETALETTYQYPSESSVLEDLGPEPETPIAPLATLPSFPYLKLLESG